MNVFIGGIALLLVLTISMPALVGVSVPARAMTM